MSESSVRNQMVRNRGALTLLRETPPDVDIMTLHLLLPLKPNRHLRDLVFAVSGTEGILGEVNV